MKEVSVTDLFYTAWEQLNPKQLLTVVELTGTMQTLQPGSKEYGLCLISILRTIRKNPKLVEQALDVDSEQAIAIAVDIFNDIQFFKRTQQGDFKTPWLYFPIGSFESNGFKFVQPTRSDLPLFYHTFEQLVYADSAFSAFCVLQHQLNQIEAEPIPSPVERDRVKLDIDAALNALIAVLYTDEFDLADQEVRARLVPLKLNTGKRSLILHTYANVRQFIVQRCPTLFATPLPDADAPPPTPVHTGPMWMNLRYDLAKTEVFKGFKTASTARIYDALDFLEQEAIHAKKQPHA